MLRTFKNRSLSKLNMIVQYHIIHILKLQKSERVDEKLIFTPNKNYNDLFFCKYATLY